MNGAELLVSTLEQHRVRYIFGVPGDIEGEFFKVLKDSSIRFFNVRHEQAGAFMADVYYRLTGKIGVCFSTLGPGATNMLTGVANAYQDRSAVLALSGQLPLSKQYRDSHQFVDLYDLYQAATRLCIVVKRARDVAYDIERAMTTAMADRRGPVHVSLPVDVLSGDAAGYRTVKGSPQTVTRYKDHLRIFHQALSRAKKVVAIVGNGVNRSRGDKEVLEFLKRYRIPVYTSFLGKGVIPEEFPLYCGTLSRHSKKARKVLGSQDLIVAIGFDVIEGIEPDIWEGAEKVAHIDNYPPTGDGIYRPDIEVIGDIKNILSDLLKNFPISRKHTDPSSMTLKLPEPERVDSMYPLHPAKVMKEVEHVLGPNDIVVSDVGLHKQFVGLYLAAKQSQKVLFSNGLSSMGFGMPAAIAAKLVFPKKRVIAICGDGGIQMNIQELATAVEHHLSPVFIVMNDGAYGMVKYRQLEKTGVTFGAEFKQQCDFVKIAEAYGVKGFRVKKPDDLRAMLVTALSSGNVSLIDVPIQQYSDIGIMK